MSIQPQTTTVMRDERIMADIVPVENVFDDPHGLLAKLDARAPFGLIYGEKAYGKLGGADPWFREHWAHHGKILVEGTEDYLDNAKLIAGAKKAFKAKVVRPYSFVWNIYGPGQPARPHFDLAPYRGFDAGDAPQWLHVLVHNSMLFIPWAVPSTTGLVIFYSGVGGGFECWPNGPDKPSRVFEGPFWNYGVVTDNEFMFHRAREVGAREDWALPETFGGAAKLHRAPDGVNWQVIDETGVRYTWRPEQLRYSLVWKAFTFKDQAAADVYDNHTDDLTEKIIWDVFAEDLHARGSKVRVPKDPMTDREFRDAMYREYPNPGLKHFADAKRGLVSQM